MMLGFIIYSVLVSAESSDAIFEEASAVLTGIEGIRLEESDVGEVSLKGTVYRREDLEIIQGFLGRHPEVKRAFSLDRELKKATPTRGPKDVFFIELVLIEVQKAAFQRLGIRMDSLISVTGDAAFGFVRGNGFSALAGSVDPIRAFLDIALQNGEARVHAKQSVVTEEGQPGKFFAGGELPIKLVSRESASIHFKSFGMSLLFTPRVQGPSRVHIDIESEISDIDTGSQVDGVPVILKKHLKTQFTSKIDQMIAIGGLVRASESKFSDKMPGLSAIPILGRLFQSKDFKNHKSEAYIFITPKRMNSPWLPSPEL